LGALELTGIQIQLGDRKLKRTLFLAGDLSEQSHRLIGQVRTLEEQERLDHTSISVFQIRHFGALREQPVFGLIEKIHIKVARVGKKLAGRVEFQQRMVIRVPPAGGGELADRCR
jgi:hypothetical protein